MYLASRSVSQGRAAGLVSLGGVAVGFVIYLVLTAFGITALAMAVPLAYDALRVAGATYLAYLAWQALRPEVRVFRLPGIYGPGRSALDRAAAPRVDAPGHRFSRIHVDDIVGAVAASFEARPGVWNIADDLPATSRAVAEHACDLMGRPYPPLVAPEALAPQARAFYSERRAIANGKMKRDLGYRLRYPSYREGLRACQEEAS